VVTLAENMTHSDARARKTTICRLEHRKPAQQEPGLDVCAWHADRTKRALQQLPTLYSDLETILNPSGKATTTVAVTPDPGIKLDHRVVTCRTDIRASLTTWTRVGIEEGPWDTWPQDHIPGICQWLRTRCDWYLAQPFGHQFVLDVTGPWETGLRLLDPNPVRRFAVGPCPQCTGTLIANLRPADDLLPAIVICDNTPIDDEGQPEHQWTADRWLHMGRLVKAKEQP